MKRFLICSAFVGLLCLSAGPANAQFQNDDILVGRSIGSDTLAVVRGGAVVADSFTQAFIAGMDFDNTGGINNNAAGNLVMVNRGGGAGAGEVYIGATDGSGTATLVGDFGGSFPGFNSVLTAGTDRLDHVAVSPDNTKVVITAPGDGEPSPGVGALILFDYDPSQVGVDNTMVLTNGRAFDNPFPFFGTNDVEWLDNDTLIIADGDAAFIDTIDLDGSGNFDVGSRTRHRELLGPTGGAQPLDGDTIGLAYNPDISPFVYLGLGDFDSGAGTASNYVWVLDPTQTETNGDWKQVGRARYDSSVSSTIRDAELLSTGDLVVTVFGGSAFTIDMSTLDGSACGDPANFNNGDGGCGGLVDDTGVTLLIDGDVVFDDGFGSSDTNFPLLTIARTASGSAVDLNGDGDVDGGDFLAIQQTDPSSIAQWESEFGNGTGPLVGASAVPEPGSALLLGLALGCISIGRRRSR